MRASFIRAIVETGPSTRGPLQMRTCAVTSCAACVVYRGSVKRIARSGINSMQPLLPVKPVRYRRLGLYATSRASSLRSANPAATTRRRVSNSGLTPAGLMATLKLSHKSFGPVRQVGRFLQVAAAFRLFGAFQESLNLVALDARLSPGGARPGRFQPGTHFDATVVSLTLQLGALGVGQGFLHRRTHRLRNCRSGC